MTQRPIACVSLFQVPMLVAFKRIKVWIKGTKPLFSPRVAGGSQCLVWPCRGVARRTSRYSAWPAVYVGTQALRTSCCPGSVAADRLWVDKVGIHFLQRLLAEHAHQGSGSEWDGNAESRRERQPWRGSPVRLQGHGQLRVETLAAGNVNSCCLTCLSLNEAS